MHLSANENVIKQKQTRLNLLNIFSKLTKFPYLSDKENVFKQKQTRLNLILGAGGTGGLDLVRGGGEKHPPSKFEKNGSEAQHV